MSQFVHLNVHSEYSLIDSTVRINALIESVAAAGMPAVALTDHCNMFGLVKFFRAAEQAGIKPIAGADVLVADKLGAAHHYRLRLLCQSKQGYLNLSDLISRAYLERKAGVPLVLSDWLRDRNEGLIALSGLHEGQLGQLVLEGKLNRAEAALRGWRATFGDRYYVEVARTGNDRDNDYLVGALNLAAQVGCPAVATNDVRFLASADFEAHEARVCIHNGDILSDPKRPRRYTDQQYLRSGREMAELFSDFPALLENSVEIARRCNLELQLGEYFLPAFPIPEGDTIESFLRTESAEGLAGRLRERGRAAEFSQQDYDERLALELDVVIQMGFPGYFLIVADFIRWAKQQHIPVGPGRGSGAGSLVAYSLGITDLDPLEHDLLFERFLNPERISMPDFDVDFCMDRRDEVIDYVAQKYGREQVSQIITYGTMAAKAVVRDTGRVLGHPYGFVDSVAKLIPLTLGIKLKDALAEEKELQERVAKEDDVAELLDLAQSLEGITRNAGKHAGGVVIAPRPLSEFSPLYCEPGSEGVVTQFDKDDVESIGLVKFDFLGLRTLTIIDWAVKAVNLRRADRDEAPLVIDQLPTDDKATFELLKACNTTAVFQLESRGMKDLIRRLQPESFDDIVALVALFRPGPLDSGMVDTYVDCKHGRMGVKYPHELLEPILKPTYGVILYQEQVMQAAQVLSGYTLGGADILRRAMGKKKPQEMAKQRSIFVDGAVANGIESATANTIFDQIETFAGYGFNKSHSAAYAVLSYQTAYLKAHYPADFMAAVLSAVMDNTDQVVNLIDDARQSGLAIQPPNVNVSAWKFAAVDEKTIVYGLGAIKGVGEAAIQSLVEKRLGKPFANLLDLCTRVDLQKLNKRALEALILSGAMDELGSSRAALMHELPDVLQAADQALRDAQAGQNDLFGAPAPVARPATSDSVGVPEWPEEHRLQGERDTLGLYLTGHPIDAWRSYFDHFTTCRLSQIDQHYKPPAQPQRKGRGQGHPMLLAGLVIGVRRRGESLFFGFDDKSGRLEVAAFTDVAQEYGALVRKDQLLVVDGLVSPDDFSGGFQLRARRLLTPEQALAEYSRGVECWLKGQYDPRLAQVLRQHPGSSKLLLHYRNATAAASLRLGQDWGVKPSRELLGELERLDYVDNAAISFR